MNAVQSNTASRFAPAAVKSTQHLKSFLDRVQSRWHSPEFLNSDPLQFVWQYNDPWDQEAVALISAVLAYGNVLQIRKSIQDVLDRMHLVARSPSEFVRGLKQQAFSKMALAAFEGWFHRFNVGQDVVLLFQLLGQTWQQSGSLGGFFLEESSQSTDSIENALNRLMSDWEQKAAGKGLPSFYYFLTPPSRGSVCKRWCMFLRWMGRRDLLDPGLWTEGGAMTPHFRHSNALSPRQLVIPLDTHTGQICQYIGLTKRKSLNWKAALEITAKLKECSPEDPVRYDFSMARLGILNLCQKKYRREVCGACELFQVCCLAQVGNRRQ